MSKVYEGTWVTSSEWKGYDEFMDKIGMGEEEKNKYRNAVITLNFKVDGNKIPFTEVSSVTPDEIIDYKDAEFGKEIEVDTKTAKLKVTMTKISDNEIHEHEETNFGDGIWRKFLIKRKVNGNNMDIEITAVEQEVTTSFCMKRQ